MSAKRDKIVDELWGKRAAGVALPEIDWSRAPTEADIAYLMQYFPFIQVISTTPEFPDEIVPEFLKAPSGWVVHDYGAAMSASLGELLYQGAGIDEVVTGADAKAETTATHLVKAGGTGGESGTGGVGTYQPGQGTVMNQAFETARFLVAKILEKGWPGLEIIDGSDHMKWALWYHASDANCEVVGFEPTEDEQARRDRLRSGVIEGPGKAPTPKG